MAINWGLEYLLLFGPPENGWIFHPRVDDPMQ